MSRDLLLEIGTEELPAVALHPALDEMKALFEDKARSARVAHGEVTVCGTPRRLAILVKDVEESQASLSEDVMGPPCKVAYDKDGAPTKVAEKWAAAQGVGVADLKRKETPKGEYTYITRNEEGRPTAEILPAMLRSIVETIHFKKSMRWGWEAQAFSRPVQWICALFGTDVVPFQFADVASGRTTRGHRFVANHEIQVPRPADYASILSGATVVVDLDQRKAMVKRGADEAAASVGGFIRKDPELLDTITCIVEHPTAVLGGFEADYLALPAEVLISEAREHQKYFSVVDADGKLMPYFVAVSNTPVPDKALISAGYERVLRARLSDARFFFDGDHKKSLDACAEDLKRVVFQQKLGTSYEKMERFRDLATYLADAAGIGTAGLKASVRRAAYLCKADLVTGMVGEFPELQGVMGSEYARGVESDEVADAIFEHYLPRFAGDRLPEHDAGALVGLGDRIDTLTGIIGIGRAPTGAADPFALRRACIGAINIILSRGYRLSLSDAIKRSAQLLGDRLKDADKTCAEVAEFFKERLRNILGELARKDVVDAVLAAGFDDLVDAKSRVAALDAAVKDPVFDALAAGFKRAANILDKQAKGVSVPPVDSSLLTDDAEKGLHAAIEGVKGQVDAALATGDYATALRHVATLRAPIDRFFDEVRVMADDPKVKANRISLLAEVKQMFARIADFSRIQAQA